ncbi:MAG: sulfite exporter TauE/SafE family protein [Candidatus Electronema sp. V4]|uniref:sulfite exporter TauE/SafE family protein n=1 Tax=Candidatus Electronema sp. V4 TaxID=3454756 RepID=UPI0040555FB5
MNWLMLPLGMVIATVALFFGLGGGVLWMPVLLTATALRPDEALLCTIVIQTFGQFSATVSNSRAGLISWPVVKLLAAVGLPGVLAGTLISFLINPLYIKLFLGLVIFFIAYAFMRGEDFFVEGSEQADMETVRRRGRPITVAASALTGFLGVGVGDWLVPFLNMRCGLAMNRAVATCIALMLMLSAAAVAAQLLLGRSILWEVTLPAVIGVLIGAQLGSKLLQRVPETRFKELFVLMLVFVATHVTFNAL